MNKISYYAPFVRGAFIAKYGRLCRLITAAEHGETGVKLSGGESDNEAASKIHEAIIAGSADVFTLEAAGEKLSFAPLVQADLQASVKEEAASTTITIKPADAGKSFAASRAAVMKDRVCLVTGGAQGFGEEITRGLCEGGAFVFIADLNVKGAEALAQKLNAEYGRETAAALEANVSDEASVEAMFEKAASIAGGVDLCVSNAGVLRAAPILEQNIDDFRFVTSINYTAFAIVTKHAGRLMRRQFLGGGSCRLSSDIIQINSKSGLEGSNKNGAYAGGKFGGLGLVQSFAKELVEFGTKVNAICPGNFFDGPLWADPEKGLFVQYLKTGKVPGAKTIADVKAFYEAKVPMGRGCEGKDVIKAIYYIVEQEYETGQAVPVTGGQVMLN